MIHASSAGVGGGTDDRPPACSGCGRCAVEEGRGTATAHPRPPSAARTRPAPPMIPRTCGLAEDEPGALVRVVGVDGHIGRAGREHAEDRDVELLRARRDAHANPIPAAHAGLVQARGRAVDEGHELAVAQRTRAVIEGGCLWVTLRRVAQDVDQGAWRGRTARPVENALRAVRVGHVRRRGARRAVPS